MALLRDSRAWEFSKVGLSMAGAMADVVRSVASCDLRRGVSIAGVSLLGRSGYVDAFFEI